MRVSHRASPGPRPSSVRRRPLTLRQILGLIAAACACLVSGASGGDPRLDTGLEWLRARQAGDGSWASDARLAPRDTSQVVQALRLLAPADPAITPAVDFLAARAAPVTDFEARRVRALAEVVGPGLTGGPRAALAAAQLPDGGWGFSAEAAVSSAPETALALQALAGRPELGPAALRAGLARLRALQQADGGFAHSQGEPSDLMTSAEVLLAAGALASSTDVDALRVSVAAFLTGAVNADGGFPVRPDEPSDVTATALVLNALLASGRSVAGVTGARDYLRLAQGADGAWLGDPYTTALALMVVGSERPDLAIDAVAATPFSVEQGTAAAVTVVVRNGGLAASTPSELALFAGDPATGGQLLGSVVLPALASGASTTLSFSVPTAGFSGMVALFALADRAGTVAEYSEVNNRRSALLDVRPPGSPPPPEGEGNRAPIITSLPPTGGRIGQLFLYQVVAHDPEGGPLRYELPVAVAPGMALDPDTGLFTWTPAGPAGVYAAVIVVRDAQGAAAPQRLEIRVLSTDDKSPPQFDSAPLSVARPGGLYQYTAQVTDPDGGPVALSAPQMPAGMTFEAGTGLLRWTPAAGDVGEHPVRLLAVDDEGASVEQSFLVIVSTAEGDDVADLTVIKLDPNTVRIDAQSLAASGEARVQVANQGTATARNVEVVLAEDRDGDQAITVADAVLGRVQLAELAAGAQQQVTIPAAGRALFRDNRLWAAVDPGGTITEGREDNNDASSSEGARLLTTPGTFDPQLKLNWRLVNAQGSPNQVITAPTVGFLTDDDGNGRAGPGDVPVIFFTSFEVGWDPGIIRGISGRTGAVVFQSPPGFDPATTPAIADLDDDGFPEVITYGQQLGGPPNNQRVVALNRDGTVRWRSEPLPANSGANGPAGVVVANMVGDSRPEIVLGNAILRSDGTTHCKAISGTSGFNTIVEDLDRDGTPEFLSGKTAWRANCTEYWSTDGNVQVNGSWISAGQLDDDAFPELLFAQRNGPTRALEHNGQVKWTVPALNFWGSVQAMADVDGDGMSEIVGVNAAGLRVLERDGTQRWAAASQFDSTGFSSTAVPADLDGDGRMEVVANDMTKLRIHRGSDGAVLWQVDHSSATGWDYPTVADVDADGRMDIVVGLSLGGGGGRFDVMFTGVRVYGDARWAPARPLWNQQAYSVSNIRCDQTVPETVRPMWLVTPNSLLPGGDVPRVLREELGCESGQADLTASYIRVDRSACPAQVSYVVRVGNGGPRTVRAGTPVNLARAAGTGGFTSAGTVLTTRALAPGAFEDIRLTVAAAAGPSSILADVDPARTVSEAVLSNNSHTLTASLCDEGNRPPEFEAPPLLAATVGQPYIYMPLASDPDADLVTLSLGAAPAGMALSPAGVLSWTPTAAQLGEHAVVLQASDGRGGLALQEFVVVVSAATPAEPATETPPLLRLAVATDAATYLAGGIAALSATVTNDQAFGRAGEVDLLILDAGGAVIATPLEGASVVFTGPGTRTVPGTFSVGLTPPGAYTVLARYREGATARTASAGFEILASAGLAASLVTDRRVYGPNDEVTVSRTLRNVGLTGALTGVSPTVEIFDAGGTLLLQDAQPPLDLGPGGSSLRATGFPTTQRAPGAYRARLQVRRAGVLLATLEAPFEIRASAQLSGLLVASPTRVQTGDEVTLTTTLTNRGNAPVTLSAVFALSDAGTLAERAQQTRSITLDAGETETVAVPFATTGLPLGSYLAMVEATESGRRLLALSAALAIVDEQPPVVVLDVPACSGQAVTPVITVSDAQLASVTRLLDGAPYDGGPVTAEGAHTLTVTAEDAAGLRTTASASFIVDFTAPLVTLQGVTDGAAYNQPVAATATASDANLTSFSFLLDGQTYVGETPIAVEGAHLLQARAVDCAGNAGQVQSAFLLDFTPPVVAIDVPACSAGPVTPLVTVSDANLTSDVRVLDGAPYDGAPVAAEGAHQLRVTAGDRASNQTTAQADFILDHTAPTVSITGVTNGSVYPGTVQPVISLADAHLASSTVTLNGAPFVSGTAVSEAGSYSLVATAVDCAGQQTSRTASFRIQPAPTVAGDLRHELGGRARVLLATECGTCTFLPNLRAALDQAGIAYQQARTRTEWLARLRSGQFNLYVLYEPAPAESHPSFTELNEAVWLGDGLVFIKSVPDAMPRLREAMGGDFGGNLNNITQVALQPPLQPASVPMSGAAVALRVSAGVVVARAGSASGQPVAMNHGVGLGRTVTLGWDTETSVSQAFYLSLLEAAAPASGAPLLPGAVADVRVIARNTGPASAAFTVAHQLPAGVTTSEPLSRILTIAAGEDERFMLPLRLPTTAGNFTLTGTLSADSQVLDTDTLTLTVPRTQAQLRGDALAALAALNLTGGQDSRRDQAIERLQAAAAAATPEAAIVEVLSAIDRVREITAVDVTAIRIDLARLLRTHQMAVLP